MKMSVTVKVICLAIFLFALDQSTAKKTYDEKHYTPESAPRTIYVYSKSDDPNGQEDLEVVKYHQKDKGECLRPECDNTQDKDYTKEQYYRDEFEVEEPVDVEEPHDERSKIYKRSTQETRHPNHRYDDQVYEESKRRTHQYEVVEVLDEESAPSETKTRVESHPDIFVYKGVEYVRSNGPRKQRTHDSLIAESGKYKKAASGDGEYSTRDSKHGGKSDKGYSTKHHHEQGAKGKDSREKHMKQYDEHGGKKHRNFDEGGTHGQHHEAAQGQKGGKFDEKEAHKKGHNTKGYHNKYQKDEYHKEHKFYDDYHKSGSHLKYGSGGGKHSSKDGGYKKKDYHEGSGSEGKRGKKGQYSKGHNDENHKSHKKEKGYEKYTDHHSDYGKKGGNDGGTVYYHNF